MAVKILAENQEHRCNGSQMELRKLPPHAPLTRSLREEVYDHLRNEMNRGGLQPGSFLDLNQLAKQLGVSRTPLREALLHLETQGFVTVLPRRGFRLNPLTLDDIRHYFEIIGALEAATMKSVGHGLGPSDLALMKQLNASMAEAVASNDFNLYYELNLAFHEVYLGKSDNADLLGLIRSLKQRLYDWPRREGFVKAWEEDSIQNEHESLIQLLERGAIDEAAAYLQNVHWSFKLQEPYIHAYFFASQGKK
jgi:DNA-binding GntR family transcriptional regulator